MMMSANESEDGVGVGSACLDSNPGEADGGAPRHGSRFAGVSRSLSRSESMQEVADNNLIVARLRRRENGRMTVCLSRVSFMFMLQEEERKGSGRTHRCRSSPRTAYASLNARNFSLA
jgi:hypothetical protein